MKPYTNQNKGNRDEDLRRNWRGNHSIHRKKKDTPNKKAFRQSIKKGIDLDEIGTDWNNGEFYK